jgi:hypothetical protein
MPYETDTIYDELMGQFSAISQQFDAVVKHMMIVQLQRTMAQVEDCRKAGGDPADCWWAAWMGELYVPTPEINWPFPPPPPEVPAQAILYRALDGMHSNASSMLSDLSKFIELVEVEMKAWRPE